MAFIVSMLLVSSSYVYCEREEPKKMPSISELVYMRNVARLSPGHGDAFCAMYPELEKYITG